MNHTWIDYTSDKFYGIDRRCSRCGHDYATDAKPCPVTWGELETHINDIIFGIDGTGESNSGHLGVWWFLKQADKCAGNDNPGGVVAKIDTSIKRLTTLKKLIEGFLKEQES